MSKLNDFIVMFDGTSVDFDMEYGAQCVDLYRVYVQEVLGLPQSPGVRGACDIWDSYLKEHYDRIANTPSGIPKEGDIMIWSNKSGGGYGHVAIFLEGTVGSFISFDQNWPIRSTCHKQRHYYTNVLGWLRPKVYNEGMDNLKQEIIDEYLAIRPMKFNEQGEWVTGEPSEDEIKARLEEKKNRVERMRDLLTGDGSVKKYWKEKWGVKETSSDIGLQTTIDTYDGTFLALKDALRGYGILPGDSNEKAVGAVKGLVEKVEELKDEKTPKIIYKYVGKEYKKILKFLNLLLIQEK